MTSNVILSSQLDENDIFTSSSNLDCVSAAIQEESLDLNLTDEESDWEAFSSPSSFKRKIESSLETSFSDSTSVGSQDLFDNCSTDMLKVQKLETSDDQGFSSAVCKSQPLSISCRTASSQDFQFSSSLTCSASVPVVDSDVDTSHEKNLQHVVCEAEALFSKTANNYRYRNLDFDCKKTTVYNLIACVIISHPIREIWCASKKCWQTMGALSLGDHTRKHIKLILWGKQCHHVLSQCSGNMIYINQVQVKSKYGELILGLASESKIITMCSALSVKTLVTSQSKLDQLKNLVQINLDWFTADYSVLCRSPMKEILPLSCGEVEFHDLRNLHCGKMVHIAVRIASVDLNYCEKSKNTPCVVSVFSDTKPDFCIRLYLNGSSRQWMPLLRKYYDRQWEIRYVTSCLSDHDNVELHTTVYSSAECNYDDSLMNLNNILSRNIPSVTSYDQLISLVKSQKSTQVSLCNISICSVCVNSLHFQQSINRSALTIMKIKRKLAAFLNKSNSRALLYSLNCCYEISNAIFTVWSSYDDFLTLLGISSLKSLHYQVN